MIVKGSRSVKDFFSPISKPRYNLQCHVDLERLNAKIEEEKAVQEEREALRRLEEQEKQRRWQEQWRNARQAQRQEAIDEGMPIDVDVVENDINYVRGKRSYRERPNNWREIIVYYNQFRGLTGVRNVRSAFPHPCFEGKSDNCVKTILNRWSKEAKDPQFEPKKASRTPVYGKEIDIALKGKVDAALFSGLKV